jgi:hypothetical protein
MRVKMNNAKKLTAGKMAIRKLSILVRVVPFDPEKLPS